MNKRQQLWRTCIVSLLLLVMSFTGLQAQTYSVVGTNTGAGNSITGYPAPFGNYYWGARHQFLITAAQLTAAGVASGGSIQSIGFNVLNTNSANTHQGFQVKVFTTTSANPLSSGYVSSGLVAQSAPADWVPATGWQQFSLTSSFIWNGTDNLVIESCFNNSAYNVNATTE